MPLPDPVMRATRPSKLPMISSLNENYV
jgi:hypothetical protein